MSDKKCYDTRTGAVLDIYGNPVPPNVEWAEERVSKLEEEAPLRNVNERIKSVTDLVEAYYHRYELRMDNRMLYRLSNVLLDDDLRSTHKHDSDILSDHQLARRREGIRVRRSPHRGREVPLSHANSTGIDGVNYALPKRRYRRM